MFTNNIIASITAPALHYIADNGSWINHNMTRTIFQILLWSTHTVYFYVVCFCMIWHPQICDMVYSCYLFINMTAVLVLTSSAQIIILHLIIWQEMKIELQWYLPFRNPQKYSEVASPLLINGRWLCPIICEWTISFIMAILI